MNRIGPVLRPGLDRLAAGLLITGASKFIAKCGATIPDLHVTRISGHVCTIRKMNLAS